MVESTVCCQDCGDTLYFVYSTIKRAVVYMCLNRECPEHQQPIEMDSQFACNCQDE